MGDENLEFLALISNYIEARDGQALDRVWEHILPDGEYLTEATSYVVEFFLPMRQEEEHGVEAGIIRKRF